MFVLPVGVSDSGQRSSILQVQRSSGISVSRAGAINILSGDDGSGSKLTADPDDRLGSSERDLRLARAARSS